MPHHAPRWNSAPVPIAAAVLVAALVVMPVRGFAQTPQVRGLLSGVPLSALQDSLSALDEAVFRAPSSAESWYRLALVKLELNRRGAAVKATMHQALGETWRHGALASLARSLGADSSYTLAATTLSDLLMVADAGELEPPLQRAVRRAAFAHAGASPYLAAARMHRGLGHADSVVASLRDYLQAGGDSGVAAVEAARALSAMGQPEAAVARYAAGAEHSGPAGRLLYRADIGWVATPADLASYDSTTTATLGEWIRNFWRRRDVTAMRPEGERLAEHLRRWNYVHEHFRIVGRAEGAQFTDGPGTGPSADPELQGSSDVANDLGALGSIAPDAFSLIEGGRRVLDDRGVVYMRHGEPDSRASWGAGSVDATVHGCIVANESWQYGLPTETLLIHFCTSRRLGSTAATTLVAMLPLFHDLIEARGALDGRYQQLANSLEELAQRQKLNGQAARMAAAGGGASSSDLGFLVSPSLVRSMRETGQRQLATALQTDSYVQKFESSLKPVVQLYAVGQPGSDGRLLVVFAIPGERLTAETRPGVTGVVYALSVRTIAVGPAGLDVFRRDTTRYFRVAEPLKAGSMLNGLLELPMPPGRSDVRVLFTQPGGTAAAAAGRDGMTLGASGSLAISDLVAGRDGAGLVWAHGGDPIPLNPLDVYPRSGVMDLYYDLSGLVPGRQYRTTLELANPLGITAGDQVRVSFEDKAAASAQRVRRSLDLKTLKGGQYRLVMTVEDVVSGAKVTRERTVNVRG